MQVSISPLVELVQHLITAIPLAATSAQPLSHEAAVARVEARHAQSLAAPAQDGMFGCRYVYRWVCTPWECGYEYVWICD